MSDTFTGRVSELGLLTLDRPKDYGRHMQSLAGARITITVRRQRSRRSVDQNAWAWGVAYPILALEFGYDKHEIEDLHYDLIAKCFGTHVNRLGVEVPNARSSNLSTKQFAEYMEWLIRFAAVEYGVAIPLPNEVDYSTLEAA